MGLTLKTASTHLDGREQAGNFREAESARGAHAVSAGEVGQDDFLPFGKQLTKQHPVSLT